MSIFINVTKIIYRTCLYELFIEVNLMHVYRRVKNIRINIILLNITYNFELMKEDSNYASFFLPILLSDIVGFVLVGILLVN
jgi:hypothetical protein